MLPLLGAQFIGKSERPPLEISHYETETSLVADHGIGPRNFVSTSARPAGLRSPNPSGSSSLCPHKDNMTAPVDQESMSEVP